MPYLVKKKKFPRLKNLSISKKTAFKVDKNYFLPTKDTRATTPNWPIKCPDTEIDHNMAAPMENVSLQTGKCFIHYNGGPDDENVLNFTKMRWKRVIEYAGQWAELECPEKQIAGKVMFCVLKLVDFVIDNRQHIS